MKNKKENKEIEVKLTTEERDRILEEIVFKGVTFYETLLLNDKLKIKLKSLTGEEQLEVDKKMSDIKGTNLEFWHNYALIVLSYSLVLFDKQNLSTMSPEERLEFIKKKPIALIDKLLKENSVFSNKIKAAIDGDLEETFFETPSTSSE